MEQEITYSLVRSRKRKRTLSLNVMHDGRIVMHVPFRTSQTEIDNFFNAKVEWLRKKLAEIQKRSQNGAEHPVSFIQGVKFFYLGELYPLEFNDTNQGKHQLNLYRGAFVLDQSKAVQARDLFIRWYKKESKRIFEYRVNYYSNVLGLSPKGIRITSAHSRYGSCSSENRLSFTWRLVMAPLSVIDYVIIHELMHIKEKNHSARFWSLVDNAMPDYKKHRLWLREHGHLLKI